MTTKALNQTDTIEAIPVAVRTASVNGSAIDLRDYDGTLACTLQSAAMSAGDTLDCKLQDSPDGSTGWADITGKTWTQVTAAADATETIMLDREDARAFVRAVGTIAGVSPSVAFGIAMIGFQRRR